MMSPKQQRRPLPSLLYKYLFCGRRITEPGLGNCSFARNCATDHDKQLCTLYIVQLTEMLWFRIFWHAARYPALLAAALQGLQKYHQTK